jgi:hypothetical protein
MNDAPDMAQEMLDRRATPLVREALSSSRIVYLNGARQAGKTTVVRHLAGELEADYVTLDDRDVREAALEDPAGFIERDRPLVVDEVQRGGDDLLLAVKACVDRDGRPGRFLLTGSTRFLTVPNLSESLAGRIDLIDLWPFSQGELGGGPDSLFDRLFGSSASLRRDRPSPSSKRDMFDRVCRGGFPEAATRSGRARSRWFESYAETLIRRDVVEVSSIHRVDDFGALVRLLATRVASEINLASVATDAAVPRTTLSRYLPLLESVYLVFRLPAWSRNVSQRQLKQAKLYFTDSGLAAHLMGLDAEGLARPQARMAGPLLESFVASELARQATWARTAAELYHFRDHRKREVDIVLEARDGRVAAIEVKAGSSVGRSDLRSLEFLRDRIGDGFTNGVVLACVDKVQPLGDRLTMLPVSALWE